MSKNLLKKLLRYGIIKWAQLLITLMEISLALPLSRFLINNIPVLSAVLPREKKDIGTDILERKLEDLLQ